MKSAGSVSGSTIRVALGSLAVPVSAVVTAPLLARFLGPAGRGEMAAVVSLVVLLSTVGTLGVPEAMTYYAARCTAGVRSIVARGTALLAVGGAVGALMGVLLTTTLTESSTSLRALMLGGIAAVGPTIIVSGLRGAAGGLERWQDVNREKYIAAALRLIAILVLAATGYLTVLTAAVVMLSTPVIAGLAYSRSFLRDESHPAPSISYSRITRFSGKVWVGSLSGILLVRLDQVLMTPLSDAVELGLYAAAVNVADVIVLLGLAARDVVYPAQSKDADIAALAAAARRALVGVGAVAVALVTSSFWWFTYLFGKDYSGALPSVVLLTLAAAVGVPGSIGGIGLAARGHPELRSYALLAACLVNVVGILLLVPSLGATGAAVATVAGVLVASNGNLVLLARRFDTKVLDFYKVNRSDLRAIFAIRNVWSHR